MNPLSAMAKLFIALGLFLLVFGLLALLAGKLNIGLFKLPGDIFVKRDGSSFYFPLMTCLVLSIVLSLLLNLWGRR